MYEVVQISGGGGVNAPVLILLPNNILYVIMLLLIFLMNIFTCNVLFLKCSIADFTKVNDLKLSCTAG